MTVRAIGALAMLGATLAGTPVAARFRPYVAVDAGAERRQRLADGEKRYGTNPPQHRWKTDLVYAAAIGGEFALSRQLFAAVELGIARSEADSVVLRNRTMQRPSGLIVSYADEVTVHPRWNASATGRLGIGVTRGLAVYGLAGFAAERVRVRVGPPSSPGTVVFPASEHRTREAVAFGAGARVFVSDRLGLRVEFRREAGKHGYDPQRGTAGILYRF